jgi:hypothetical protein
MAYARNEAREQRIAMKAVVDAYGSGERAMGWYYYLDGKMKFPFKARCRFARPTSVLKVREEVEVLGMAPEEECESEMFVWAGRAASKLPSLWRNCDHCRKIKRPRRPSAIGFIGWIAGTSYERRKARYPPLPINREMAVFGADSVSEMARPRRFELLTSAFGGQRSIQLSYGRVAP